MKSLMEIYSKTKDPMEKKLFLERITYYYKTFKPSEFYDVLVAKMEEDKTETNKDDMDRFKIQTYNQWIKNLISYLEENKGDNEKFQSIQTYLESICPIKTLQEAHNVEQELKAMGVSRYTWRYSEFGGEHISSDSIDINEKEPIQYVKHRLYINCKEKDLWKMMSLFKEKCEQKKLRYYFKFLPDKSRTERFVIYSETKDLLDYVKILEEIEQENPNIVKGCGEPALLSGKINDWVGIADEPENKGAKTSYNLARSIMLGRAMEKTLIGEIKETYSSDNKHKNRLIKSKINRILTNEIVHNYRMKDIFSKRMIRKMVDKFLQERADELYELETYFGNTSKSYYSITIGKLEGKDIELKGNIFDEALPPITSIIEKADLYFYDKLRNNIQDQGRTRGYDTTKFCFNRGTKNLFMQYDSKIKIEGNIDNSINNSEEYEKNSNINTKAKNFDDDVDDSEASLM